MTSTFSKTLALAALCSLTLYNHDRTLSLNGKKILKNLKK